MFAGICSALIGVMAAVIGGRSLATGINSKTWNSVRGRIVGSYLEEHRQSKGTRSFTPRITYEYETDGGETVRSQRISFGFDGPSPGFVGRRIISRFPVGSEVDVFIDPDDPSNTIIDPGAAASSWFALGLGLTLTAIGFVLLARA